MWFADAERVMQAAVAKAPKGQPLESFVPYLRAAIPCWRLKEQASRAADDLEAQIEAVAKRIELENEFRRLIGRSFHTEADAISHADVAALPDP